MLDAIVRDAIHDDQIPGAVVLVWHNGQVVYRRAFGNRALEPRREPMTVDTIFDVASLTKVVATTTAVMQLVQKGEVRLNDPVAKYLPEFAVNGKEEITVRNLLTHFSGLRADIDLTPPWEGRDTALRMVFAETPRTHLVPVPLQRYQFSSHWGAVERVSEPRWMRTAPEKSLPAGDDAHRFLPPAAWRRRIAPTEDDEQGKMLRGVVHDPGHVAWGAWPVMPVFFSTAERPLQVRAGTTQW